jgi:hypothetical protein
LAQDLWASSGYGLLERTPRGLEPTDAWLAHVLAREELAPPAEALAAERALHARLTADPRAPVARADLEALDDPDARDNWRQFLQLRERLATHGTIQGAYRGVFADKTVTLAPALIDLLAQLIVRDLLGDARDAFLARAGELFFRLQRVSTDDARVLCADAVTIERFGETGGFGTVGRFLQRQGTRLPEVKMDILSAENAGIYFLRDELFSFVIDVTAGSEGARALATMLERWTTRMTGARVRIEPLARVEDARWRWHVGLDTDASALLDALYRGESVAPDELARLLLLFRLEFVDAGDARRELEGRPVYLALGCRPDRTLRMKPQNLLANLPLARA